MNILGLRILLAGVFWLDFEGMSTKVISLGLKKIGREIFSSISVVEAKGGAERWGGNTPKSPFADSISPARLCLIYGLGEEFVK